MRQGRWRGLAAMAVIAGAAIALNVAAPNLAHGKAPPGSTATALQDGNTHINVANNHTALNSWNDMRAEPNDSGRLTVADTPNTGQLLDNVAIVANNGENRLTANSQGGARSAISAVMPNGGLNPTSTNTGNHAFTAHAASDNHVT